MNTSEKFLTLPFKNIAVTLLFCVILGPVGLLYSSVSGGIVMMTLALLTLKAKLVGPALLVWLISCVWGVIAANHYNKKILKTQVSNLSGQRS